jgi:hypothetical protein
MQPSVIPFLAAVVVISPLKAFAGPITQGCVDGLLEAQASLAKHKAYAQYHEGRNHESQRSRPLDLIGDVRTQLINLRTGSGSIAPVRFFEGKRQGNPGVYVLPQSGSAYFFKYTKPDVSYGYLHIALPGYDPFDIEKDSYRHVIISAGSGRGLKNPISVRYSGQDPVYAENAEKDETYFPLPLVAEIAAAKVDSDPEIQDSLRAYVSGFQNDQQEAEHEEGVLRLLVNQSRARMRGQTRLENHVRRIAREGGPTVDQVARDTQTAASSVQASEDDLAYGQKQRAWIDSWAKAAADRCAGATQKTQKAVLIYETPRRSASEAG